MIVRWLTCPVATALCFAVGPGAAAFATEKRDSVLHVENSASRPRTPSAVSAPPALADTAPGRADAPYADLIRRAAERHALAPELIESIIRAESNFEPRAVSPKGAKGLMQLMPATARLLGVRNVFDVRQNIDGGVRHLRYLMERFSGNVTLAVAAYNAGDEAVSRYGGVPPYEETRAYVTRVLALLGRADHVSTARSSGDGRLARITDGRYRGENASVHRRRERGRGHDQLESPRGRATVREAAVVDEDRSASSGRGRRPPRPRSPLR
jgi:transglycosylase-like protein with SLT domain